MQLATRQINRCPTCHMIRVRDQVSTQLPLLTHGGHGEAITTTVDHCRCESRIVLTETENPRSEDRVA